MINVHGAFPFEEEIISNACVLVIPRYINSVPIAVVHLHVCPHVSLTAALDVRFSADKCARNAEFVAKYFQCLGIALANEFFISVEKRCGGVSLGSLGLSCCVIIIFCVFTNIVVNIFQGVISRVTGLNCALCSGDTAVDSAALAVCPRISFIRGYCDCLDIDGPRAIVICDHIGRRDVVGMISDPEYLRMVIGKSDCTEIYAFFKIIKSLIRGVNVDYFFSLFVHSAVVYAIHLY